MIIIPDKLRRPAEVEREELRKQLSEARAEIERLNKGIKIVQSAFKNYKNADAIIARTTLKKAQILSASCNSDAVDSERAANEILTTEIERKSKLIEQMREALEAAKQDSLFLSEYYLDAFGDYKDKDEIQGWPKIKWVRALRAYRKVEAALAAAERGDHG